MTHGVGWCPRGVAGLFNINNCCGITDVIYGVCDDFSEDVNVMNIRMLNYKFEDVLSTMKCDPIFLNCGWSPCISQYTPGYPCLS